MNKQAPVIADIEWFKRMSVRAPSSRAAGKTGKGGRAPARSVAHQGWRVANGSNAAVFKRIRNAGTHHPKQLAGQMAYINGKADLVFGNGIDYEMGDVALTEAAVEAMIEQWSDGWRGQPKNGHTTHLVLSFPGHVTAEQTASIVEEWCEDMFQAVDAGLDEWSYYAAVHLDQEHHPHVHVIVNNRGLRGGDWFYMAEGHDFSYQNMKQRMVEISEDYGVYLDASTRLERGIVEYAPSHAEYRRSIRLGIEPKGRARSGVDLDSAFGTMFAYAQQFRAMATVAESIEQSEMADRLRAAASDLEEARPIYVEGGNKMEIDVNQHPADIRDALNAWALKNEEKIAALNENDRKEVTDQLHKTLDHIETVLDRDFKVEWTPPAAQLPAYSQSFSDAVVGDVQTLEKLSYEYADYIASPDIEGREVTTKASLDDFWREKMVDTYVSTGKLPTEYSAALEAVEAAYTDLSAGSLADGAKAMSGFRQQATDAGLDPDRLQRRMEVGAINAREEEEWTVGDIEDVIKHQGLDGTNDEHVAKATAVVRALQDSIAGAIDEFANRHHEVNHVELRTTALQVANEVATYGEVAFSSPESEQKFIQQMRATYGSVGIMEMANNRPEMLNDITEDEAEQRAIIYAVLKHEEKHHQLGLQPESVSQGLDYNNPRPGHEIDGHSL